VRPTVTVGGCRSVLTFGGVTHQTQYATMKTLARVAAVLAFLFCLIGGLWILFHAGFKSKDDAVWTGLGLYFVGKAFFVGPMLLVSAELLSKRTETK
jgi:hypothetical protein